MCTVVRGAWAVGMKKDTAMRISPRSAKKKPMGKRKSSIRSGKQEIQCNQANDDDHGQGRRPLVPGYILVMLDIGESVDQVVQFGFGLGLSGEADEDGQDKRRRKSGNRDPEILRHRRRKDVVNAQPSALSFGFG